MMVSCVRQVVVRLAGTRSRPLGYSNSMMRQLDRMPNRGTAAQISCFGSNPFYRICARGNTLISITKAANPADRLARLG